MSDNLAEFTLYKKEADKGNSVAQFQLALMYESGRAVTKNYLKAIRYYELSASNGYIQAHYNLGNIYYRQGLFSEAEPFYLKALEISKINLGLINLETNLFRWNLASNYFRNGDIEDSIDLFDKLCICFGIECFLSYLKTPSCK